jgi:hypothetical protein
MEKLNELISLCKASVTITINNHKDGYQTVLEHIDSIGVKKYISEDVLNKMVNKDTVIELQAYPDTPIGSYTIYDYDVDKAVESMLEIVKNNL